uniref:hypothetical protein n=1 Tax=Vibrio cholerae TaxID=666 RepID=UPI001C10D2BF
AATGPLSSPADDLSDRVAKDLTDADNRIKDHNGDGKITVSYEFKEFSEAKKKALRESLRSWEDVIKIKFVENGKHADSHLLI